MNKRLRRFRHIAPKSARRVNRIALAAFLAAATPIAASADCAPCDTGSACSGGNGCVNGQCVAGTPAVPAACDWAIVGGNESADARARAGYRSVVEGSVCGQHLRVDGGAVIDGNLVTTGSSDSGIRMGSGTSVDGQIVTEGSDCQQAIDSVKPTITTLDSVAFRSTGDAGNVSIPGHAEYTITATRQMNVLDFTNLVAGEWSTLTLDGNSIPGVTFVLRVNRRLYLHYHSTLVLTGGAAPERVILYGREECRIGQSVTGAGTVFCPYDSLSLDRDSRWTGALVGGGDRIDLRHDVELTHVPTQIPVP